MWWVVGFLRIFVFVISVEIFYLWFGFWFDVFVFYLICIDIMWCRCFFIKVVLFELKVELVMMFDSSVWYVLFELLVCCVMVSRILNSLWVRSVILLFFGWMVIVLMVFCNLVELVFIIFILVFLVCFVVVICWVGGEVFWKDSVCGDVCLEWYVYYSWWSVLVKWYLFEWFLKMFIGLLLWCFGFF